MIARRAYAGDVNAEPVRTGIQDKAHPRVDAIVGVPKSPALFDGGSERPAMHEPSVEQARCELGFSDRGRVEIAAVATALPLDEIANDAAALLERQRVLFREAQRDVPVGHDAALDTHTLGVHRRHAARRTDARRLEGRRRDTVRRNVFDPDGRLQARDGVVVRIVARRLGLVMVDTPAEHLDRRRAREPWRSRQHALRERHVLRTGAHWNVRDV